MTMWTRIVVRCWLVVTSGYPLLATDNYQLTTFTVWHFRHDWLFTPFVVVVGGKYFLPVPECRLLWIRVSDKEPFTLPSPHWRGA